MSVISERQQSRQDECGGGRTLAEGCLLVFYLREQYKRSGGLNIEY